MQFWILPFSLRKFKDSVILVYLELNRFWKIRSSATILVRFFCVGWQHNNDLYPVRFRFVEYRFPCNGKRTKKPDFVHDQCGSNGLSIVARIHSYSISSLLGISWLALHNWTVVGRFKYDNINCQRSIVLLSDSGFF